MIHHDDEGFTYVTYAADKRALKIGVFFIDSPTTNACLSAIIDFVTINANRIDSIANMQPVKYWQLVERLSTMFCRSYSPTKNYNITKPEIRGAVYFVLDAGLQAGRWPEEYVLTDRTFVQYGGDFVG